MWTPTPDRNARGSLEKMLLEQGFTKAAVPEFRLFPGDANIRTIYQKRVAAGERIVFGLWGVLVVSGTALAAGCAPHRRLVPCRSPIVTLKLRLDNRLGRLAMID